MSASPSEFLVFYRGLSRQILRSRSSANSIMPRPFGTSVRQLADKDIGPNKTHTLDKGKDPNVQSHESMKGRENRANSTGGTGTEQKDVRNSAAKAKEEFPEAPDTAIGMQDERGGKGH